MLSNIYFNYIINLKLIKSKSDHEHVMPIGFIQHLLVILLAHRMVQLHLKEYLIPVSFFFIPVVFFSKFNSS